MKRKRETGSVAVLAFLLATAAPLAFSQDLQKKPSPVPPVEILGPQLIAWSQVQKPQPLADLLLSPSQSQEQPGRAADHSAQEPPQQQPAAQTLTGTIVRDSGRYVLKVSSSSTYELDDQERAKRYEGKQVKVAGMLSGNGNSFHVISIELIS
jgi:hypothetical protein